MNIALIGYGKMGKSIEKMAIEKGHQIVSKINYPDFEPNELNQADVAIEFTQPDMAIANIKKCFEANIPVIVGTTGWYEDYPSIKKIALDTNQTLFTATNFSLGVNILFHINEKLAQIMNQFPQYNVEMTETHHLEKKDHPSGTASTLAEGILNNIDRKSTYVGLIDTPSHTSNPLELHIKCNREENVPGFHQVTYASHIDEIKISHNAINRQGFTQGALMAAEWIYNKKGVYTMNDLIQF